MADEKTHFNELSGERGYTEYYSVRLRKNVLSLANMQKRTYGYVHCINVVYL